MNSFINPLTDQTTQSLVEELNKSYKINPDYFNRFNVKRGLRNSDGTGVMAGITKISSVDGYYIEDGERVPKEGHLYFRGFDMQEIVKHCQQENRFGYEEVAWLLIFGSLPTTEQLARFKDLLAVSRNLPEDFIEDTMMKAPSPNIMNKITRTILALYSYDESPDDTSLENVVRQSVQLVGQLPIIMAYAYQVKRRHYLKKSMYIHPAKPDQSTAETILRSIRSDKAFTDDEAKLLDLCLMVHAEHGGGNNSTFATRVLTSSGTDTYAAIAAGMGALKGPKHGGANLKVMDMMDDIKRHVKHPEKESEMRKHLSDILDKKAFDHQGLIYGMGHAVYTKSDPRALVFKSFVKQLAEEKGRMDDYRIYETVERIAPELILSKRPHATSVTANVDFYSGFVYDMLGIPRELYTPLFATARIVGWSAHRLEELITSNKILRPAYVNVVQPREYIPLEKRRGGCSDNRPGTGR